MKRISLIVIGALALAAIISACGQDELAKDLTPIPTLRPGETPALNTALVGSGEGETTPQPSGEGAAGDKLVALGKDLFTQTCTGCHGAADGAGPSFAGMAERAATRIEGTPPEDYIHQSIVDPSAYVVEGFPDIMPKDYGTKFSDEQINGLVAYIMAESGGGEAATEATPEATSEATEEASPEATEAPEATQAETPEATEASAAAVEGDPAAGEDLFMATCSACHGEKDGPGPARVGMGERAATRVDGMAPEDYLHESIVDPSAYVVEGFSDIMPKTYGEQFSDEEINNLVAFLLTQ